MRNLPSNKYLAGISNVFIMLLPVSLLSSFSLLASNGADLLEFSSISRDLHSASVLISQLFPVLLVVFFAQYLASLHKQPTIGIITSSILVYFIVCLQWGGDQDTAAIPINFPFAILLPILVSFFYQYFTVWSIFKDPHLPSVVGRSINLVISVSTISLFIIAISYVLKNIIFDNLHIVLEMPTLDPMSLFDGIIYELTRGVFWSIGINGHVVLSNYKTELFAVTEESLGLIELGKGTMPILTSNFYDFYTGMGGSGNTLSLVLCVLIFAKNKGYKHLAQAAFFLSIFNINEPILYGLPIMFNPIMIIPFLIAPIAGLLIAYFATLWGIVPPIMGVISWMTPPIIGGYLGTNGAISASILQGVILLVGMAVYYPFFMRMDKLSIGRTALDSLTERFFSSEKIDTTKAIGSYIPHLTKNIAAQKEVDRLHKTGNFILYYQPQYNIKQKKVVSLEVLIRHRSYSGKITPPTFIQSFSELGLLAELDFWVLEKAITTASIYADNPNFKVSINVSPETVLVPTFLLTLSSLINNSCLVFSQLELEITEELLIKDEEKTKEILSKLRLLGVKIALDDFGSGYSSIAYLSHFDFDKVKIDRSLLLNIDTKRGRKLFSLAVELGRITGASIVVEGAEQKNEVEFVQSLGIECIQGFFFYRPMPIEDVINLGLIRCLKDDVCSDIVT